MEIGEDGVALLTIDVPGASTNVLTAELTHDLSAAIERIRQEVGIKGVVIISGKPGKYVTGVDIEEMVTAYGRETPQQSFARSQRLSGLYRRLETCGKPVAAAINGA